MTTWKRRVIFPVVAIVVATVTAVGALFAIDLYLHHRAERSAGLNVWGYRGPRVNRRISLARVVVLGGSTVFGYGVTWDEAFPAQLQKRLERLGDANKPFSVVNLGYNNEGAYAFRFTLEDYEYLRPDVVVLYEGYNDLLGPPAVLNHSVYRHTSPLFRTTGYFPILPLVFREKAMALTHGGDLNAAYASEQKTVFRPGLAARVKSGALNAAASVGESLERQIARVADERPAPPAASTSTGAACEPTWADYCQSVAAAIDYALARQQRVVFVTQPYLAGEKARARHRWQQATVAAMLRQRYGGRKDVQYVDLGQAIDLSDTALSFDGMHLTPVGNQQIAERLAPPVFAAAEGRGKTFY